MRVIALLMISLLPLMAHSASIYLCRAYDGGTFWSSAHCNQHKALIERIANVPDGMSFDLQVNIAQQQRTQKTEPTVVTNTVVTTSPAQNRLAECKALDAQITHLDSLARQPQTGQMQDWISAEKKKARDQQFRIKC